MKMPMELAYAITSVDRFIKNVYPDRQINFRDLEWLMERAILAPHNHTVDEINNCVLEKYLVETLRTDHLTL